MEISKIIPKIRFRIGDTDETKYSDYEILEALNEGNRMFRKLCVDSVPDLITEQTADTLENGNNLLEVADGLVKVTEVRINGRKIIPTVTQLVDDLTQEGTPTHYVPKYIGGVVKLRLYPIPTEALPYTVDYISEVGDLSSDDSLNYPRECIEALIDYVLARLGGGDAAAFEALRDRVDAIVNDIVPRAASVKPYY